MNKYEKYKTKFKERLTELMPTKNISDFSRKIGIPERTINSWLRLKTTPRMKYIIELSLFFEVSTDYLLGLED